MKRLPITHITATSAIGRGMDETCASLLGEHSGLQKAGVIDGLQPPGWIGEVAGLASVELPPQWQHFDCRNNRLAWLALNQDEFLLHAQAAVERYGANRVAVILGTSTSGIAESERAYRQTSGIDWQSLPDDYDYRHTHNMYATVDFVAQVIGAKGHSQSISTACSSSGKVFASAHRALNAGLCDAVIVGGVDSLCFTTLFGFHSLQLVSPEPCRPADAHRQGISIGEAGGFALIERDADTSRLHLLGYGESSDAYHMSTPDPAGAGAKMAMQAALNRAGLQAKDIDYINFHGTGTRSNDSSEDAAVFGLFGDQVPCSSSKGWTGHCLGAAGIIEVAICSIALEQGWVPPSLNTVDLDAELQSNIAMQAASRPLSYVMSNSFGFGGTNCSLLLGGAV